MSDGERSDASKAKDRPAGRAGDNSPDNRTRLVLAALELFARSGYEAASTRAIADAAGANISLIKYHFGGKEGLRAAVAEYLAERIGAAVGPAISHADQALQSESLTPDRAGALLKAVIDRFVGVMIANPEHAVWARFILREQAEPTAAFDILYERVMARAHGFACRIVGLLVGKPSESAETKLRVFAIMGELIVFRAAHAAVLRRMGWAEYGPEEARQIRDTAYETIDMLVAAALAREEEG